MKNNLIDNRQIRIFISSTFQDMQDERDYLMKRTFPKLRKLASQRDITLIELDLRWGITEEESKSGKVVEICLREIENSVPFFIGIIGNRYGWVPEAKDLSEDLIVRFPSVNNYLDQHLSVTEMEMQFGVLERPEDMHAYFYIKEQEEKADNLIMLQHLKDAVKASRYPSSTYSSLEDLAAQVETAFTQLLDRLFPEGELSEHQKEKLVQQSFISKLSATYIKDENNFHVLDDFAKDQSRQILVVTGESGLGKSSLMANWAKENATNEDFTVIPYFSSNGGNQLHSRMLRYLSDEICERFSIEKPQCPDDQMLEKIFDVLALKKKPVVIILDAINQIADIGQSKMLNWLPLPPSNVKFIFSTLEGDQTMRVFENRSYPVFRLQRLSIDQKKKLIEKYLISFGKKLSPEQVSRIIRDEQCNNTLVLKTLLDELISYGHYDTLDEQIEYYLHSGSVGEFYDKVIARFEQDFGKDFVRRVLGLIAVSRTGVSEEELIHITGIKQLEWSDFFCSFATHLNNQSGRFVFTHSYITSTVWRRYLEDDSGTECICRICISKELKNVQSEIAMKEIPYQLDKLKAWDKLHDYITNFKYLVYCMDFDEVEIGTYWRHIDENLPGKYSVLDYLECLDGTEDKITLYTDLLRLCSVRYLIKPKRKIVSMLLEHIKRNPELATPKVYQTLAASTGRPESIDYANMSLKVCREQGDVLGEIESLRLLGGSFYDAAVKENDDEYARKAYDVWERAKDLSEELYGEVHPLVMNGYKDMALVCDDDLNKALSLALKGLELSIAIYGADHPLSGRPYHYVGVIYRELHMWPDALHYFEEACRVWLPAYGRNHEILNSSYGNQGKALMNMGRPEEALKCYDTCLSIQDAIFEEKGYDYAVCQMNRARILATLGRKEESLEVCDEIEKTLNVDKVKAEARSIPLMKICHEFHEQLLSQKP